MNNPPNPEIRRLLGGYATGNLTDAEQKQLFEAALQDQELFDALAQEQALRDLLEAPGVKQDLIAALLPPQPTACQRLKAFLASPMGWGAGGIAVAAALLSLVIVPQALRRTDPALRTVSEVAEMRAPTVAPKPVEADASKKSVASQPRARQSAPKRPAVAPVVQPEKSVAPTAVPAGEVETERKEQVAAAPPPPPQVAYRVQEQVQERRQAAVRDQAAGPVPTQQSADTVQQAPASAVGNLAKTASAKPAPPYVFESRNAAGAFEPSAPAAGRVRLRVFAPLDGIALLQVNRDQPLRVAIQEGVVTLLPSEGIDVNPATG